MKVYTEVVIDMNSLEVVYEEWYEYSGPVCELKGGGGGGSTSGKVDFPDYMKTLHGNWLNLNGAVALAAGDSVTDLIRVGINNSPYMGETAYDPDSDIAAFLDAFADYSVDIDAVEPSLWDAFIDSAVAKIDASLMDDATIGAASAAHGKVLDDRLESEVLPRFEAGMRDINAVISSSFVIGKAIIEGFNERSVAEFDAKLRAQSYVMRAQYVIKAAEDMIGLEQLRMAYRDSYSKSLAEAYRIKVVMKKEELSEQLNIDDKDYRWGLELFQYGANVLSSISGSAVSTEKTPNSFGTALGGALSGAAVGAMIPGPTPITAGIGAVVGGVASLF